MLEPNGQTHHGKQHSIFYIVSICDSKPRRWAVVKPTIVGIDETWSIVPSKREDYIAPSF